MLRPPKISKMDLLSQTRMESGEGMEIVDLLVDVQSGRDVPESTLLAEADG